MKVPVFCELCNRYIEAHDADTCKYPRTHCEVTKVPWVLHRLVITYLLGFDKISDVEIMIVGPWGTYTTPRPKQRSLRPRDAP